MWDQRVKGTVSKRMRMRDGSEWKRLYRKEWID